MPLPPPGELIDYEAYVSTWPMGAEKCELLEGVVVWYGEFSEEDRVTVERTFPGRVAILDETGCIELHPGPGPAVSLTERQDG